jgi:hypothetical protein
MLLPRQAVLSTAQALLSGRELSDRDALAFELL